MHTLSRRAVWAGLALAALWPGPASAQEQTLKIVFPYSAGSSADSVARMLADHMQKSLGRPVIVENRTGAGGRVGARAVKEAAPDGATLLFSNAGLVTILPHVYANLGYDPLVDLLPVTQVVKFDLALVVSGKLPVRSVPELVAWLKANPDQATFGSPAVGSAVHFAGIELGRLTKLDLRHVPYKGTPAAVPDLMTGRLPMYIASVAEFIEHHKAGSIRILATMGARAPACCPMSRRCGRAASTSRRRHGSRCGPPQARPRMLPNACERQSSTPCAMPRTGPGSIPSATRLRGRRVRSWLEFSAPSTSAGGRSSRHLASRRTSSEIAT